MKIPDSFFVAINPLVGFLLRSRFHSPMSSSLMLITFKGRKTGRSYTTPVRYSRCGDAIRCFTGNQSRWWRNLTGGAEVVLRVEGRDGAYQAHAITDPAKVRSGLDRHLADFPQDAPYYDVVLDADNRPRPDDLNHAAAATVMVEAVAMDGTAAGLEVLATEGSNRPSRDNR